MEVRVGLIEMVTSGQRFEGDGHVAIWERNIPEG